MQCPPGVFHVTQHQCLAFCTGAGDGVEGGGGGVSEDDDANPSDSSWKSGPTDSDMEKQN